MIAHINDDDGSIIIPEVIPPSRRLSAGNGETKDMPFPFSLDDLAYWIVRRKDGTIIKYTLTPAATGRDNYKPPAHQYSDYYGNAGGDVHYVTSWCSHKPSPALPVFEASGVRIFVGSSACRTVAQQFDFVIDCGAVLGVSDLTLPILSGDPVLVSALVEFEPPRPSVRILKIDWEDREAPGVSPNLWPALAKLVKGDVLTCCMGGHGRSGTAAVCLMMALSPSYTPYDAVCHLRAVHCARAIESKDQHDYIGEVAKALGRDDNTAQIHETKNFREAFLKLHYAEAKPLQRRLLEASK